MVHFTRIDKIYSGKGKPGRGLLKVKWWCLNYFSLHCADLSDSIEDNLMTVGVVSANILERQGQFSADRMDGNGTYHFSDGWGFLAPGHLQSLGNWR